MLKLIEIPEEGIEFLAGQVITLFCLNYIYTGKLVGANSACVLLENPAIVYETGPFTDKSWKDAQPLPDKLYVMLSAVEAFGVVE